jgi:hypothetical protein
VLAWQKTFGGTREDIGRDVLQTEDGGYVLAGGTFSFAAGSYADVYLVKTDSAGILEWQKTFGGSRTDFGYSVLATADDGFAVLGESNSFGTGIYPNAYLIKTDADGNLD